MVKPVNFVFYGAYKGSDFSHHIVIVIGKRAYFVFCSDVQVPCQIAVGRDSEDIGHLDDWLGAFIHEKVHGCSRRQNNYPRNNNGKNSNPFNISHDVFFG